ncbi:MAG TPA: hypothetical protein DCR48_15310 [Flavobacteriales bacterium]|nr:hypothetical protein [Flavobacteriales bacterium]
MEAKRVEEKIEEVKQMFALSTEKAEELHDDFIKLRVIADEAILKGERARTSVLPAWKYIKLFYAMIRDYMEGSLTNISKKEIIPIIAAFVYFVSPVDVFPNYIPAFGYLDDAFIIGLVASMTKETMDIYQKSKKLEKA